VSCVYRLTAPWLLAAARTSLLGARPGERRRREWVQFVHGEGNQLAPVAASPSDLRGDVSAWRWHKSGVLGNPRSDFQLDLSR